MDAESPISEPLINDDEKLHYVILSVDAMPDTHGDHLCLQPPKVGTWTQTEDDELYEFGYLGEEHKDGKHRKWVAELTEEEFDRWLDDECYGDRFEARKSGEHTMGMITELGHLPAYALNDDPMAWNIGGVTQVILRQAYVGEYALATEKEIPADAREALAEIYGLEAS